MMRPKSTIFLEQSSPGLWKELAKEVRSNRALLEGGFLKPVSAVATIADHRTQELFFEAVYRLWKVRNIILGEGGGMKQPELSVLVEFCKSGAIVDISRRTCLFGYCKRPPQAGGRMLPPVRDRCATMWLSPKSYLNPSAALR